MASGRPSVLIVYGESRPSRFQASDAGVLDEVRAVSTALDGSGLAHRSVSVRTLQDLTAVLSGADETVVFNLVEVLWADPQDYNYVPALVEAFDKACTGNNTTGMLLAHDKWWSKALLTSAGIPCPPAILLEPGQPISDINFKGPYIVKPTRCDASEGLDNENVVESASGLTKVVEMVWASTGQAAMVEQFIDGREINVSILWEQDRPQVLPLAEIEFRGFGPDRPKIVGYRAKWIQGSFEYENTVRVIPAELDGRTAGLIRQISLAACRTLECLDYCRVDLRLDASGRPSVLEVNPNPDISPEAGFAAALDAAGISYQRFIQIAIDNAIWRRQKARAGSAQSASPAVDTGPYQIRRSMAADRDQIIGILVASKVFRPDELAIAREVMDAATAGDSSYESYVAANGEQVLGWICFGKTPCTIGTYDIYWLVVRPDLSGRGIGRRLVRFAEEQLTRRGARLIAIETSSRQAYVPARCFYHRLGYKQSSLVKDFYGPGDDKVIYTKALGRAATQP